MNDLSPALSASIAIVRERDEARSALNELMQHIGGFRSHELGLPLTWDEAVRNARDILAKVQP